MQDYHPLAFVCVDLDSRCVRRVHPSIWRAIRHTRTPLRQNGRERCSAWRLETRLLIVAPTIPVGRLCCTYALGNAGFGTAVAIPRGRGNPTHAARTHRPSRLPCPRPAPAERVFVDQTGGNELSPVSGRGRTAPPTTAGRRGHDHPCGHTGRLVALPDCRFRSAPTDRGCRRPGCRDQTGVTRSGAGGVEPGRTPDVQRLYCRSARLSGRA